MYVDEAVIAGVITVGLMVGVGWSSVDYCFMHCWLRKPWDGEKHSSHRTPRLRQRWLGRAV